MRRARFGHRGHAREGRGLPSRPDRSGCHRVENVRRHELGGEWVGSAKTKGLKSRIEKSVPDIALVESHTCSIQALLTSDPNLLDGVDLLISATGDWGRGLRPAMRRQSASTPTNALHLDGSLCLGRAFRLPYREKGTVRRGFDETGNFKGRPPSRAAVASRVRKHDVALRAVELAQAQAAASRLALEVLAVGRNDDVWRTWTAEDSVVRHAEGGLRPTSG